MNLKEKILVEMVVTDEDIMVNEILKERPEFTNSKDIKRIRDLYREYKDE